MDLTPGVHLTDGQVWSGWFPLLVLASPSVNSLHLRKYSVIVVCSMSSRRGVAVWRRTPIAWYSYVYVYNSFYFIFYLSIYIVSFNFYFIFIDV